MIVVIDYGAANLGSMRNMLKRIGVEATVTSDSSAIASAEKIILPGVGSFDQGIEALGKSELIGPLKNRVLEASVPILGVCLGAQLLGLGSAEGSAPGLGFISLRCQRLPVDSEAGIRVPHMGWNYIQPKKSSRVLNGLDNDARFYFVHSYYMVCESPDDVLATTTHGISFASMICRDNVYGAQFHPEKSHKFGLTLLKNFVEL